LLALAADREPAHNSAAGRITTLVMRALWTTALLIAAAGPVLSRTTSQPVPARDTSWKTHREASETQEPAKPPPASTALEAIGSGPQTIDLKFACKPWRPGDPPAMLPPDRHRSRAESRQQQSLDAPD